MKTLLHFHIGSGKNAMGFYQKGGILSFKGVTEGILSLIDHLFYYEEEDELIDDVGNNIDYHFNEDGSGYFDEDGIYDKTIVVVGEELDLYADSEFIYLLEKEIKDGNSAYEEEIKQVLKSIS